MKFFSTSMVMILGAICIPPRAAVGCEQSLRVVPAVGVVLSDFAARSGNVDYRSATNPSLGCLLRWQRTTTSAFETGALVEWRSASWFSSFAPDGEYLEGSGFKRRLDLAYLLVPVRLRVGLRPGAVTPSLLAGVELGRRLSARETTVYRETGVRYHPESYGRSPLVTDWELAFVAGARITLARIARSPFVEAVYQSARSNVDGGLFKIEGSLPSIANRGVRVLMGFDL